MYRAVDLSNCLCNIRVNLKGEKRFSSKDFNSRFKNYKIFLCHCVCDSLKEDTGVLSLTMYVSFLGFQRMNSTCESKFLKDSPISLIIEDVTSLHVQVSTSYSFLNGIIKRAKLPGDDFRRFVHFLTA